MSFVASFAAGEFGGNCQDDENDRVNTDGAEFSHSFGKLPILFDVLYTSQCIILIWFVIEKLFCIRRKKKEKVLENGKEVMKVKDVILSDDQQKKSEIMFR